MAGTLVPVLKAGWPPWNPTPDRVIVPIGKLKHAGPGATPAAVPILDAGLGRGDEITVGALPCAALDAGPISAIATSNNIAPKKTKNCKSNRPECGAWAYLLTECGHGTKKVELEYTQVLRAENGMLRYRFPLKAEGESAPVDEVKIDAKLSSKQGLRTIWSPTH